MPRHFNIAGPCIEGRHYMIPPLRRLPEAPRLIERMDYFILHAPRQTGKTTTLVALAQELTAAGSFAALHFSCETGEVAGEDHVEAQRAILRNLRRSSEIYLPESLHPPPFSEALDGDLLTSALTAWARTCARPIALFFDEIDALRGQSLVSVLRQLRSGLLSRPGNFPYSIVLCGLRDVRDYKAAHDGGSLGKPGYAPEPPSGGDSNRLGTSSPFNIKVESLRIGDFTFDDVRELYAQHTADTGQAFTEEALARAFELSAGQPWLVNALARQIVEKIAVPPSDPITAAHFDQAKERLILERATHLDSLVARLMEPRVRRVIEPILAGSERAADAYDDDVRFARDLGLLTPTNPVRIANPIYKEVVVRVLADGVERVITDAPSAFVLPDGRLAFRKLLRRFVAFGREHGEALMGSVPYAEVAPQLVPMAYLQRLVNGGGFIDRQYGVGRGRIDLLVRWPYTKPDGTRAVQRRALELKVWRTGEKDPLAKGLAQLEGYLQQLGLRRGVGTPRKLESPIDHGISFTDRAPTA